MASEDKLNKLRKLKLKYEKNPNEYILKKLKLGTNVWEEDNNPTWDILNYDYAIKKVPQNVQTKKTNSISVTMWKDDYGRVYVDKFTYSILREDKKLSIRCKDATMKYYNHTDGASEDFNLQSVECDDISENDENSLRYIYRFISSIASGIRRPSDKDNAIEARKYLKKFLEKNYIKVN